MFFVFDVYVTKFANAVALTQPTVEPSNTWLVQWGNTLLVNVVQCRECYKPEWLVSSRKWLNSCIFCDDVATWYHLSWNYPAVGSAEAHVSMHFTMPTGYISSLTNCCFTSLQIELCKLLVRTHASNLLSMKHRKNGCWLLTVAQALWRFRCRLSSQPQWRTGKIQLMVRHNRHKTGTWVGLLVLVPVFRGSYNDVH